MIVEPVGMPDPAADRPRVPHWETAERLGILDNERAVKISGSMFTMQRGAGATLAWIFALSATPLIGPPGAEITSEITPEAEEPVPNAAPRSEESA